MGFLEIIRKNKKQDELKELKERILKNKDAVFDILSEGLEAPRTCPFLLGKPCVGKFCNFFMPWIGKNDKGEEMNKFFRCAFVQQPLLIVELNEKINILINELREKR